MYSSLISYFGGGFGAFAMLLMIALAIGLLFAVIMLVSLWKIFTKAGQPGWAAIIPVYSYYILTRVARVNIAYFIVLLVPTLVAITKVHLPSPADQVITIAVAITSMFIIYNLCKQFGKGIEYTLGMIFLPFIFFPMLAFGDSIYQGGEAFSSDDMPVAPPESVLVENNTPVESPVTATVDQAPTAATQ